MARPPGVLFFSWNDMPRPPFSCGIERKPIEPRGRFENSRKEAANITIEWNAAGPEGLARRGTLGEG
jgi:hypothetical protein